MKKLLLLVMLIPIAIGMFQQSVLAQTNVYHPFSDSAVWRIDYVHNTLVQYQCNIHYYFQDYSSGDTLINAQVYKKIKRSYIYIDTVLCSNSTSAPNIIGTGYIGALRDDTLANKAFFLFPNTDTDSLLYDYNLNVGDTMDGFISRAPWDNNRIVLSIDSVLITGEYRKRWNFDSINTPVGNDPFYLIQGIGTSCGLIELATTYSLDFTKRFLVCVYDSSGSLFVSGYNSEQGCKPIVESVNEVNILNALNLYPNPASTIINIQSLVNSPWSMVTIHNTQGALVYHSIFDIERSTFDISQFPSGLYYLHLQSGEGVAVKKFEVIH
ncbi:MAG: T9SS type A sorting domain-containing protein [Bacteroidia bacterium]